MPISDTPDTWKWTCNDSELCTLASAWEVTRDQAPKFDLYSVVWFPNSCPKMSTCLLRALHDKLLTRDFLLVLSIAHSDACSLCITGHGSRDHFFFSCSFSFYIWSVCELNLGLDATIIGSLTNECKLVQDRFKGKNKGTVIARVVLKAAVWHIWK